MNLLHAPNRPVNVLLDTDIGNDVDDVIALSILAFLHQAGEVNLIGIMISNDAEGAGELATGICNYYGFDPPVYVVKNGIKGDADRYLVPTLRAMGISGFHGRRHQQTLPEFFDVLRRAEHPFRLITIGFFTNIARILGDRKLHAMLDDWCEGAFHMAGNFVDRKGEYNVFSDARSFKSFLDNSTLRSLFVGFEVGRQTLFEYDWIHALRFKQPDHPLIVAYDSFRKPPYDRPCWDPVTVLIALGQLGDYAEVLGPGRVKLDAHNVTTLTKSGGNLHYAVRPSLRLAEAAKYRIQELFKLI